MKVVVVAFATASDVLGQDGVEVNLPEGSRVRDLGRALVERHPKLQPMWGRLAVAVDGELVGGGHPLEDGVEVALLPPVSGGSGA
jgi:molybdopterin converting factor small subunit